MRNFLALLALLVPSIVWGQAPLCPTGNYNFNGQCLNNPSGVAIIRGQTGTGTSGKGGGLTLQPGTPAGASTAEGDVTLFSDPLNPAVSVKCSQPTAGNIATATCTFANITVTGAGGGAPGGVPNNVQYNNSGTFGGISNGFAGEVLTSRGNFATPDFELLAPPAVLSVTLVSNAGNITLSGSQTIDGVATVDGNTVLVTAQTDPTQNGLWTAHAGAWTRFVWPTGIVIPGASTPTVVVSLGNTLGGSAWNLETPTGIVVDTTAQTWDQNTCNTGGTNCAQADGQFHPNGSHLANPTVSGTGCSDATPGLSGDNSGAITATGADTCTLTFSNVFMYFGVNRAPYCSVAGESATVLPFISTRPTASAVIFKTAAAGTFEYVCIN